MRISTSLIAAAVAGGTLSLALDASSTQDLVATLPPTSPSVTPTATESASAPPEETQAEEQTSSTAKPTTSNQGKQDSSQPTAQPTEQAPTEPVTKTISSDPINYKYGVIQIEITATDGRITQVRVLQGDASYGRDAAYDALIQATIQVQGTNYGNVSGATFTTEAFKQAINNALAKL